MRFSPAFFAATVVLPVFGAPALVPITKRGGTLKENSYVMHDGVSQQSFFEELKQALSHPDSALGYQYSVINGVSATVAPSDLAHVRNLAGIASIEQDQIFSIPPIEESQELSPIGESQPSPSTGDNTPNDKAGEGVTIYGLDTGIYIEHECFEGRASWGWSAYGIKVDDHGHGTHTAGTAIGKGYGVATKAHMVSVKVMNAAGTGSTSDIIKGIDYVCNRFAENKKASSITTMSIGGGASEPLDSAVENCIAQGMHFTVAAGNDNRDAKDYSPARAPNAITVGAVDSKNVKASFSNHGPVVDIQAPGVDIVSAGHIGSNSSKKASGTSMATPYVAGILAVALSNHGQMFPQELSDQLKGNAQGACTGMPDGTTNLLATRW
ncbi:unnamed protein product [Rhizoctonia solani]|uniref:Peptidase S8/S53 domain-containing protein n=1 Tax=Rhizoctonia solani TaxID=456999 RepID=A0A8H3AZC3_9AGAM|nr:unnamed protein product [Rhizoctonia solani]